MKRIWHHPQAPQTGKRYWRSLGELEDTPQFREWMEREFPAGTAELEASEVSRRNFVKLMGASTALAGLGMSGCRRPETYIVPYLKNVEWFVPGKALLFATAMPRLGGCLPLVVTTYEGRPTKLGGNAHHPINQFEVDGKPKSASGTDMIAQASILGLYDPDRSRDFLTKGAKSSETEFLNYLQGLKTAAVANQGKGLAFLVGESTSPTRDRLLGELAAKFSAAKFYRYEAFSLDNVREGNKRYFGRDDLKQVPRIAKATRILSLDCDFLGSERLGGNEPMGFSVNRRADRHAGSKKNEKGELEHDWQPRSADEMNRLYVIEPAFTVTGSSSDHRLRLAPSQVYGAALAIAQELGVTGLANVPTDARLLAWVKPAVEDLKAAAGKAIVLAGQRHAADVHILVAAINEKLGAFGKTIDLVAAPEREFGNIQQLSDAIDAGQVTTLISTTEADPFYDAPDNLGFAQKLAKSKVACLQLHGNVNHSAVGADWHIPAAHYLESWGDARAIDGTYSVIQPMILPLFGGWSELDLFLKLLQKEPLVAPVAVVKKEDEIAFAERPADPPSPTYLAVRDTFTNTLGLAAGAVAKAWNNCLRDGFLPNSAYQTLSVSGSGTMPSAKPLEAPSDQTKLEVRFVPDSKIYDGRYVNNGWLQETPDPISKITWDNAALLSLTTFAALGLKRDGQRIKLSFNGRSGFFPVMRSPGHADNCLTIAVGYGQRVCGRVGYGTGFNAYQLRTQETSCFAQGASVQVLSSDEEFSPNQPEANRAPDDDGKVRVSEFKELPLTQEHHGMEGRALVRDGTISEFHEDRTFGQFRGMDAHIPENFHLYKPEDRKGNKFNDLDPNHQWAMTIDLNSCLGCGTCQVACQAENNIPIVGRDQVLRGREMAWIRMDRYFADPTIVSESDPDHHAEGVIETEQAGKKDGIEYLNEDAIEVLHQPVACQQCEAAPCEAVCPVNATVHSDDGLNAMAYNRCIGTRYCANNCPYKARRFNWFDFNKRNPLLVQKVGPLKFNNLYAGPLGERHDSAITKLQKNPNVTVRMRGVMEKCTYCVQRIEGAKIAAKVEARDSDKIQVATDVVKTACQEACPVEAIQFGNLRNETDTVNAYKASPRNYDLLKYVNTRPRTSYLARIKNPNVKMPNGAEVGTFSKHLH